MSEPTAETVARIKEVAKLRIEGATWRQIAERYQYKHEGSACSTLTQEHPELWREEYEAARASYLDSVEAEALLTQRELLRSKNLELRQRAAHSLLAHCAKLRAQKLHITGDLTHDHRASTTDLINAGMNGGFKRGSRLGKALDSTSDN